jgi:hypothetical protein
VLSQDEDQDEDRPWNSEDALQNGKQLGDTWSGVDSKHVRKQQHAPRTQGAKGPPPPNANERTNYVHQQRTDHNMVRMRRKIKNAIHQPLVGVCVASP